VNCVVADQIKAILKKIYNISKWENRGKRENNKRRERTKKKRKKKKIEDIILY